LNFPKYKSYKPIDVPWIKQIPLDWDIAPTKRVFQRVKEVNRGMICDNRLALTMNGVTNRELDDAEGLQSNDYEGYQIFNKDDLVFKLIDLQNIKTSRVGQVPERGIMSPAYIRLVNRGGIDTRFGFWYFMSLYWNQVFNGLGGGVRQTLGQEDLGEIPFPLPTLQEQKSISKFLDIKTKKIDDLILEQEKLIHLLMEKRASIISNALLRGVNQMTSKISMDIEWMEEIPAHWVVQRLKYSFDLNPSISEIENIAPDELVPFFPMESIGEDGKLSLDYERPYVDLARAYTYFRNGDVVIAKVTPCFENGKGALIQGLKPGFGFGTTELAVLRPKANLAGKYLYYISISEEVRSGGVAYMTGAGGLKRVPDIFYGNLDWPLPPLSEQIQIVSYLDAELEKNEQLRVRAAELIELLKEYRCSLISEAVIGGIRVSA
jgi:type I restriction enzyme, S subunit